MGLDVARFDRKISWITVVWKTIPVLAAYTTELVIELKYLFSRRHRTAVTD
jgi:hypothetical protein